MKKIITTALLATALTGTVYADTYTLDPDHTNARFAIGHFNASTNQGGFYGITGEVQYDAASNHASLEVLIPVGSVQTGNTQFDDHLKGADFFDVAEYPMMTFKSTAWEIVDGQPQSVTGNLTILGQTHPVTLMASRYGCYQSPMFDGATVCGGDFETVIDRTQWGMNYLVEHGMPKEVRLNIQVEAVKQ